MQQALIAAQELGDEKMGLLQAILEKIEIKTRLLDQDHKNLGLYESEVNTTQVELFLTITFRLRERRNHFR